jgi:hypothetical protein
MVTYPFRGCDVPASAPAVTAQLLLAIHGPLSWPDSENSARPKGYFTLAVFAPIGDEHAVATAGMAQRQVTMNAVLSRARLFPPATGEFYRPPAGGRNVRDAYLVVTVRPVDVIGTELPHLLTLGGSDVLMQRQPSP